MKNFVNHTKCEINVCLNCNFLSPIWNPKEYAILRSRSESIRDPRHQNANESCTQKAMQVVIIFLSNITVGLQHVSFDEDDERYIIRN